MTDVDEVLARSAAWQEALEARDVERIADYLHADYALELVVPSVVTMKREEWLRLLPDYIEHEWTVLSRSAHADGDVAAVLHVVDMKATVAGHDRSGRFILSDVWRRDPDGAWRVWRRHSTPLHAGEIPRG